MSDGRVAEDSLAGVEVTATVCVWLRGVVGTTGGQEHGPAGPLGIAHTPP